MDIFSLSEPTDLGVYYDADILRYDPAYLQRIGMTKEIFINFFSQCPTLCFRANGQPIGGMIFDRDRTGELHFAVLPEYHGRWKSLWQPGLQWVFAQKESVHVSVERFNEKCIRFMNRQGYRCISEDDLWIKYLLTAEDAERKSADLLEGRTPEPT
jgi:hypothetical protein